MSYGDILEVLLPAGKEAISPVMLLIIAKRHDMAWVS